MKAILVPVMLVVSSMFMSFAWIGHLRFHAWTFGFALFVSWMLVLPEYVLNVFAVRWGREVYTGAQMAAFNLCAGVVCVALVSKFFLGESMTRSQICGFVLMAFAVILISGTKPAPSENEEAKTDRRFGELVTGGSSRQSK